MLIFYLRSVKKFNSDYVGGDRLELYFTSVMSLNVNVIKLAQQCYNLVLMPERLKVNLVFISSAVF